MAFEYIEKPSGVDIDFALSVISEDEYLKCDINIFDASSEHVSMYVTIHQKLRNWFYLVEGNDNVAYIVHYSCIRNLKYEWGE